MLRHPPATRAGNSFHEEFYERQETIASEMRNPDGRELTKLRLSMMLYFSAYTEFVEI